MPLNTCTIHILIIRTLSYLSTFCQLSSVEAGICNATGGLGTLFHGLYGTSGMCYTTGWNHSYAGIAQGNGSGYSDYYVDLSRSNNIFGKSNTVTPLSRSTKFFIKY